MHRSKTIKILRTAAVIVLWLTVWEILAVAVGQEILIPAPHTAFLSFIGYAGNGSFWVSVLLSMTRIIAGFLLGIVVGVIGAVLSSKIALFRAVISPILHLVRAVPVASFIILAFVWIRSDRLPVFISFLMVLPMVWSSVESGINNIDKQYLEMIKVFKISPVNALIHIKIPFIMPSFIATVTNALGFAWKSGIAAEVICRPDNSIGRLLQDSKLYLDIPGVFALTGVVAILSLLLEQVLKMVSRRFTGDKH